MKNPKKLQQKSIPEKMEKSQREIENDFCKSESDALHICLESRRHGFNGM